MYICMLNLNTTLNYHFVFNTTNPTMRERERGIIQFKVLYAFDSTGMERTAYYLIPCIIQEVNNNNNFCFIM